MKIRPASKNDIQAIEVILKQSGLPYSDCREQLGNFLVVEESGKIFGVGGFEHYDKLALLRSIAVLERYRGENIGDAIFTELKARALSLGVKELYLLTETAEQYFKHRDFIAVDRELVPEQIRLTKQFSSLCSSSAVVMKYAI